MESIVTDYKVGDNVELTIFDIDSIGICYSKKVKGKVEQITKNLIAINNGKYVETYLLHQLVKENKIQPNAPYELDNENYTEDIVEDCIKMIKSGKCGYLFNINQLKILKSRVSEDIEIEDKNGILKIKLKNY